MIKFSSDVHWSLPLLTFLAKSFGGRDVVFSSSFRCTLWLMRFWLESRMRHFHYSLSKCILLGAVKAMDIAVWMCICVCTPAFLCVRVHERANGISWWWDPFNDISNLLFYQSRDCSEAGDLEVHITSVNETPDGWLLTGFSSLLHRQGPSQ